MPVIEGGLRSRRRAVLVASVVGGAVLVLVLLATAGAMRTEESRPESSRAAPIAVPPAPSTQPEREQLVPYTTVGYRNGRPRAFQVVELGTSRVEVKTAQAFLAMQAAAASEGISLTIESGFRSRAEQKALYLAWRRGEGNRAARPGRSNHESGRALDISVRHGETGAWLASNAKRFGFKRTVASEPWHWEYVNAPLARSVRPARGHRPGRAIASTRPESRSKTPGRARPQRRVATR